MSTWKSECFARVLKDDTFQVQDPGPMRAPVRSFSVRRDQKLRLLLETKAPENAKSAAVERPPGTLRIADECVVLSGMTGSTAKLVGVVPFQQRSSYNEASAVRELRETATIQRIEALIDPDGEPAYIIDWLENVGDHGFVWPERIKTKSKTTIERTLGVEADASKMIDWYSEDSTSCAVSLVVDGQRFYLCDLEYDKEEGQIAPGCIIFLGTPDDAFRKKIRNCLSFALGVPLVHLGITTYSNEWNVVSFESVSAKSMSMRAFELVTPPPVLLHPSWRDGIDARLLSRVVNSIFAHYDALDFGALSWAYWYALGAPIHIAAVHFGALIEALQRRFMELHANDFPTALTSRNDWSKLRKTIEASISQLPMSEENRTLMRANVGLLNQVPRRAITDRLLAKIAIRLGTAEERAWRRRHDAAHGNEIESGTEREIIKDIKLLRLIFHRMILRMTNASESYRDFYSLNFPIRKLEEPIPEKS